MKTLRYILPVFLLVIWCQAAHAGMYRCVTKRGKVRYTDTMESERCSPVVFRKNRSSFDRLRQSSGSKNLDRLARKYDRFIRYSGVRYDIDPHLIRAVIRTESGFNPKAVSSKGAQGLMQLMPATAKELKVRDPFDPESNIDGGTRYLRTLLNTFKQDVRLALAAYNAGPGRVKQQGGVPRIPETVNYVKRVLKFYRQYKNGAA